MKNNPDTVANEAVYTTTCSYDCGARCLLKVNVKNGEIDKIFTEDYQGLNIRACPRGLSQKAVVSASDRLVQPMVIKTVNRQQQLR